MHTWEQVNAIQGPVKKYHPPVTVEAAIKLKPLLLKALLTDPKNEWARDMDAAVLQKRIKAYMERGQRWKLDNRPRNKPGEGRRHEDQKKKKNDASSISSGASGNSVMTMTTTTEGVIHEIQFYIDNHCIDEEGQRRNLFMEEYEVLVTKIKPLLIQDVSNNHVKEWGMAKWKSYIQHKISTGKVKANRISGINQGKSSAEVNGQCSGKDGTCVTIPFAPDCDCTDCAFKKLGVQMISVDDKGVKYSHLNEDGIRVVVLLVPGESRVFLSGRPTCKKTGIAIQFHTCKCIVLPFMIHH